MSNIQRGQVPRYNPNQRQEPVRYDPSQRQEPVRYTGRPQSPTPPTNPTTPSAPIFDDNVIGTAGGYETPTTQTTNVTLDDQFLSSDYNPKLRAAQSSIKADEVDVPMFGGSSKKMGSIWNQISKGFSNYQDRYKKNYINNLRKMGLYEEPVVKNPYPNPNDYQVDMDRYEQELDKFSGNSLLDNALYYPRAKKENIGGDFMDMYDQYMENF